jgi:hypothetical protein
MNGFPLKRAEHHGPAETVAATVPHSLASAARYHAERHCGGDLDRAVAELLEGGLCLAWHERIDAMLRRELAPLTLAAKRARGEL